MKTIVEYYDPETDKAETSECISFYHYFDKNKFEFIPKRTTLFKCVLIDSPIVTINKSPEKPPVITIEGYQFIVSSGGYWKTRTIITFEEFGEMQ